MDGMIRWSPIRDMMKLSWNLDQFFRDFFGETEGESTGESGFCPLPPVETYRSNGSYIVKVELPGVDPQNVHLTAQEGILTIEGERRRREEIPQEAIIHEELCYGSFKRTLELPQGIKSDQIKAKYANGILEIQVPVEARHLPKKIEVQVER